MNIRIVRSPRHAAGFAVALVLVFWSAVGFGDEDPSSALKVQDTFTPSGSMGDGEYGRKYIEFDGSSAANPRSVPACVKVKYTFGPKRWAGVYWQNKPDNWGDRPGNNYATRKFHHCSFWARGEKGGEVVEFKAGGILSAGKPYKDSFEETCGRVTLTNEWKEYKIGFDGADLSSVIGGFCWVASADFNQGSSIAFFLDDIVWE